MKKTKRILSMILILCLALSVSVPAVFAGDNNGVLEYTFGFEKTLFDSGARVAGSAANPYAGDPDVNPGYPIYSGNGYFLNLSDVHADRGFNSYEKTIQVLTKYAQNWFAIEISGVNKGTYNMEFAYQDKKNSGDYEIYVIPRKQYNTAIGVENLVKLNNGEALDGETNDGIFENLSDVINANNIETITYGGTANVSKTYNMGNVYFPEQGSYVLLFRCVKRNTGAQFCLNSLTMTPVLATVKDGETTANCTTADALAAAIENAASGTKITLQSDVAVADFTLNSGVILDLNGKTLNASVNDAAGEIIDYSGGAGRVKGATLGNLAANQMVLTDKDGYLHICDYTLSLPTTFDAVEAADDGNSVRFWFNVRFENAAAYDVIAAGNSGFTVGANFRWNDNTAMEAKFGTDLSVEDWASKMKSDPNYSFYVDVTGLQNAAANGTLTVLPTVSGEQGTSSITSGLTHTVTAAQ